VMLKHRVMGCTVAGSAPARFARLCCLTSLSSVTARMTEYMTVGADFGAKADIIEWPCTATLCR
jgi:hypothetical protein